MDQEDFKTKLTGSQRDFHLNSNVFITLIFNKYTFRMYKRKTKLKILFVEESQRLITYLLIRIDWA